MELWIRFFFENFVSLLLLELHVIIMVEDL